MNWDILSSIAWSKSLDKKSNFLKKIAKKPKKSFNNYQKKKNDFIFIFSILFFVFFLIK